MSICDNGYDIKPFLAKFARKLKKYNKPIHIIPLKTCKYLNNQQELYRHKKLKNFLRGQK